MNTLKRYALSSLTTFVTVGASSLAIELSAHSIEWTSTFWFTVSAVVIRAGFKAVIEGLAAQHADPQGF